MACRRSGVVLKKKKTRKYSALYAPRGETEEEGEKGTTLTLPKGMFALYHADRRPGGKLLGREKKGRTVGVFLRRKEPLS